MKQLILIGFCLGLTWADLAGPESARKNAISRPGPFANWTGVTEKQTFCDSSTPTFICLTTPPGNTNILCTDLGAPSRNNLVAILVCGCEFPDGTGGDAVLNPQVYSFCGIVYLEDQDSNSLFCLAQCIYCNERTLICYNGEGEAICLCFCGNPFLPRNEIPGIAHAK